MRNPIEVVFSKLLSMRDDQKWSENFFRVIVTVANDVFNFNFSLNELKLSEKVWLWYCSSCRKLKRRKEIIGKSWFLVCRHEDSRQWDKYFGEKKMMQSYLPGNLLKPKESFAELFFFEEGFVIPENSFDDAFSLFLRSWWQIVFPLKAHGQLLKVMSSWCRRKLSTSWLLSTTWLWRRSRKWRSFLSVIL